MLPILNTLLDAVAPIRCAGCGEWDAHLCYVCTGRLIALPTPPSAGGIRAAFPYREPVSRVIAGAKYGDRRTALRTLAELAAPRMGLRSQPGVLVPIPLGRRRRRGRGYNQAALIAQVWSEVSGAAVNEDCLVRSRETRPQVGRHRGERSRNIAGAFAVIGTPPPSVTLVDDVHTTGATLRAAAAALHAAGVVAVGAAVLAKTI